MILGGAMILGFSAFKGAEVYTGGKLATVEVYFHGNPLIQAEVADESKWNTNPNGLSCDNNNQVACMLEVEDSDLNGLQLDSTKVTLGAIRGSAASGYIPEHLGGSGSLDITIINRNQ